MHYKTCVWDDARVVFGFGTSDSLLPSNYRCLPMYVQRHSQLVMSLDDGPCSPTERPIQAMGGSTAGWCAIARSPLGVCYVMFGQVNAAKEHVAFFLEQASTPTTLQSSQV